MIYDPISILEQKIQQTRLKGLGKLPSLRSIAREYDLPFSKIHKATIELLVKGQLKKTVHRKGFYLPESQQVQSGGARHPLERIVNDLRRAVDAGQYLPGQYLPTRKELCSVYRCGLPLMEQSLSKLTEQGLFIPHGRKFKISGQEHGGNPGPLILASSSIFISYRDAFQRYTLALQRYCHALNWNAPILHLFEKAPLTKELPKLPNSGVILIDYKRLFPNALALQFTAHLKQSIAWIDFTGQQKPPAKKQDIIVTASSQIAGTVVAKHLMKRNHHHIAYLGWTTKASEVSLWIQQRYKAIKTQTESVGYALEMQVALVTLDTPSSQPQPYWEEMEIIALKKQLLPGIMHEMILGEIFSHHLKEGTARELQVTFKELIQNTKLTAWVGCNDFIAAAAIKFLRKQPRNTHLPEIIGFDNSPVSAVQAFSSYDFPWEEMAVRTMRHFLHLPTKNSPILSQPEGHIVVRS